LFIHAGNLTAQAGYWGFAPFLTRSWYEVPGAWLEIKMAALLDLSAAVFLGFFASRFDFLWPLAITAFLRWRVRV